MRALDARGQMCSGSKAVDPEPQLENPHAGPQPARRAWSLQPPGCLPRRPHAGAGPGSGTGEVTSSRAWSLRKQISALMERLPRGATPLPHVRAQLRGQKPVPLQTPNLYVPCPWPSAQPWGAAVVPWPRLCHQVAGNTRLPRGTCCARGLRSNRAGAGLGRGESGERASGGRALWGSPRSAAGCGRAGRKTRVAWRLSGSQGPQKLF